jgi:hypothetical protein
MTANIAALENLFTTLAGNRGRQDAASINPAEDSDVEGPIDFDTLASQSPPGLPPDVIQAVRTLRSIERSKRLWDGDTSEFNEDHSRADLALCDALAKAGLDAAGIDLAMRGSGLYRPKWERPDYRQKTIGKALEYAAEASGHIELSGEFPDLVETRPLGTAAKATRLRLDDGIIDVGLSPPPPRSWIVEGLLLAGKSAILAGLGGVSKSQLAIQLAIYLALGIAFGHRRVTPGNVLLLLGEEDRAEISRRVNAVARWLGLTEDQLDQIRSSIRAFPLVGQDIRLTRSVQQASTDIGMANDIVAAAEELGDVKLIVLDHMGLIHGGEFNAREDASVTMRIVNYIAQQTGAAVLVLAHTPKHSAQAEESDSSMVAGSTAFVDQARGALVLATMRENEAKGYGIDKGDRRQYASLSVVKNNYGPTGGVTWFRRVSFDEVGLLEPIDLYPPLLTGRPDLTQKIVDFIKANPGQYAKSKLRDSKSGKDKEPFRASKNQIEEAVETAFADGRLIERPPTEEERNKFGLTGRVKQVLDVPSS